MLLGNNHSNNHNGSHSNDDGWNATSPIPFPAFLLLPPLVPLKSCHWQLGNSPAQSGIWCVDCRGGGEPWHVQTTSYKWKWLPFMLEQMEIQDNAFYPHTVIIDCNSPTTSAFATNAQELWCMLPHGKWITANKNYSQEGFIWTGESLPSSLISRLTVLPRYAKNLEEI